MPHYRNPAPTAVDWKSPAISNLTLHTTGQAYRYQKGSGRSIILLDIIDGESVEDWTRRQATRGFDVSFCVGSLKKHMECPTPAYRLAGVIPVKEAKPKAEKKPKVDAELEAEKKQVAKTKRIRAKEKAAA